ncbi:hypothetical protein PMIN04_009779, partial [Paraphaeosphaeria minitans]
EFDVEEVLSEVVFMELGLVTANDCSEYTALDDAVFIVVRLDPDLDATDMHRPLEQLC